jgi:hypothetical protein
MLRRCILLAAVCLVWAAATCQSFVPTIPRRHHSTSQRVATAPLPLQSPNHRIHRSTVLHARKSNSRGFRKRATRALASFAFAVGIFLKSSAPALAGPKDSIRANDILMNSLRPGISAQEAEQINKGELVEEEDPNVVLGQPASSTEPADRVEVKTRKVQKKTSVYDYGEEDYEEEDDEIDFEFEGDVKKSDLKKEWLDGGSQGNFAMKQSSGPTRKMYTTAAFSIMVVPVTWLQTREFLRGRKEQQYVEKGLKILEAQKAEYFNVTSSSDDGDIQDELKGLKDGDDDDDDDDDEDWDSDDEDWDSDDDDEDDDDDDDDDD